MRFSIVIPAYRAAGTLAVAIESALSQTLLAHEVIVVDDCSPDDQPKIAKRYGDRIRYIRHARNGGEAAAKNTGVAAATGDYVVTLDADDEWLPGRLSALARVIDDDPTLDIVTSNATIMLNGREICPRYGPDHPWPGPDQRMAILESNFIFSHAAVRRERWREVGGMTEDPSHGADWPLWVNLILTGSQAGLAPDPLVLYNIVSGSLSDSVSLNIRTQIAAMTAALEVADLTPAERKTAESSRAKAQLQQRLVELMTGVWDGEPRRRALLAMAARQGCGKRDRAKAALAAVAPRMVRSRMAHHPDKMDRP